MRLDNITMPTTAEHLKKWTIQLMLDGITPPTTYTRIDKWIQNEEAKNILHTIPLI